MKLLKAFLIGVSVLAVGFLLLFCAVYTILINPLPFIIIILIASAVLIGLDIIGPDF